MSNFIVDIIIYWHFVSKSVIYRNNNGRPCATERVNESGVWSPGADSSPEPISTTFSSGTDKLATARRLQSALPIVVSSRRVAQTTADWLLRRRTAHRTEMRHFSLSSHCRAAFRWLSETHGFSGESFCLQTEFRLLLQLQLHHDY